MTLSTQTQPGPAQPAEQAETYIGLARQLAQEFALTAVERDQQGGTPLRERNRLRQSQLLKLVIPKAQGGLGQNWRTAFAISRELAKVDSSLAHVFSYHHLGLSLLEIFGSSAQKTLYYQQTAQHNWFWCNALNPLDRRATLTRTGDTFQLDGSKSFCSGSHDADILPTTAVDLETGEVLVLLLPSQRVGISLGDDWDSFGQRQTDSGSIGFTNVPVYPEEILGSTSCNTRPFGTIRACLTQLNLAHIYLGIAEGAFSAAQDYTRTHSRPWLTSGVDSASQDPYLLHEYGSLWVDLQAASGLTERAGDILQATWDKGWDLTTEERGDCAVAIAAAKVATTRTGLAITNRIFELMGARATSGKYGFDRYWRNLRTFTLHDPADYKLRDLGHWVLNHEYPQPNFYA